jgi:hypothetical protein
MPRLSIQQTNFTAGELTPRISGRTDIDRYQNGAARMLNCHPVVHGGSVRRAGTRFAKAAKFAAKKSRLIEFVFSRDVAYMLEFGDLYVRVFGPSGVFLTEIVSPYTEQQVQELDYTQGADTMFLWHGSVFPQRLRRFGDTIWDLSAAPFTAQPFDEQGEPLNANLTLSALTGAITVTASAPVFLPSDVGRNLVSGAGIGVVTAYTDTTHVNVTVSTAFLALAIASGAWYLDVSPQGFAIPSAKDPSGASITIAGATTRAATLTLTGKTGAITINASAGVFVPGDTGKVLYADSGIVTLTYVSATQCTGTTTADFAYLSYPTGSWGVAGGVWRVDDVGKYVRLNGGLVKITAFTSDASVRATIVTVMTSVIAVSPLAWSLEATVWNAANGYPRTGTLFEQRLWAAGSSKYPQTIWGSKTAVYLDFTKGTADSDACIFTIASDEINPISFLAAGRNLLVHTYGGEFTMQGGTDKPITPSNVQIKPQSTHGSKNVRPVTVGKESIFVQRAGRKLRALSYSLTIDGYQAPDLSVLAEHITYSGITALAYQQEPDLQIWGTRTDGTLLSCTLDRDQNVAGWAQHITDGAFESVATMPNGDSEQLWAIVRRTVNGATVRYVEYFDATFAPMLPGAVDPLAYPPVAQPTVYGTTMDCSLQFDNVAGQKVFAVPHLIGKTVDIIADGCVMPQAVVDGSGNVTLTRNSLRTLIGLHFDSQTDMLTPEVGTGTGTAQGNSMSGREITLRFLNTSGATVLDGEGRAQDLRNRAFGVAVLDKPPSFYSGLIRVEALGWERGRCALTIAQRQPLPMHLLSVIRKLTVND